MRKSIWRRWGSSPILAFGFRLFLGGLFLYAGWIKAQHPAALAQDIYNYRILPGWAVNPLAIALPWVEMVTGSFLLIGVWVEGASLVASALFAVFAASLFAALVRGLDIACGCFGGSGSPESINWLYLLRDLGLLAISAHVFTFDRGWNPLGGPGKGEASK